MGYDPICMIIMDCNQGAFISLRGGRRGGWITQSVTKRPTKQAGRLWTQVKTAVGFKQSTVLPVRSWSVTSALDFTMCVCETNRQTPVTMWIKEDTKGTWLMPAGCSHHPWCSQPDTDLWWWVGPPPDSCMYDSVQSLQINITTNIYITTYVNRQAAAIAKDKN